MAGRVHNALGATPADPCPTAGDESRQYCSLTDYRSWREAAALLWQAGIIPTWAMLSATPPTAAKAAERAQLEQRVRDYAATFNALPATGSVWSSQDNRELVTQIAVLMTAGDALLDELQATLTLAGLDPPPVPIPQEPPPARRKSPLRRYIVPGALGVGVLTVIGLTAWAAMSSRETDGRARDR